MVTVQTGCIRKDLRFSMKMMLAPVLELRYRLSGSGCRKEERLLNKENDMNSEELLRLLFMESSLEHLMTMDTGEVGMPTFAEYITQLAKSMGEAPERVINRADLDKSYGHQLFRGIRNPSRDTVLMLAFGFKADYARAQTLLKIARKSPLHPRVKRDMVIIFCLHHGYSIVETQLALSDYGLPLLGGRKNE